MNWGDVRTDIGHNYTTSTFSCGVTYTYLSSHLDFMTYGFSAECLCSLGTLRETLVDMPLNGPRHCKSCGRFLFRVAYDGREKATY
jgi:hypothetical protein